MAAGNLGPGWWDVEMGTLEFELEGVLMYVVPSIFASHLRVAPGPCPLLTHRDPEATTRHRGSTGTKWALLSPALEDVEPQPQN